MMQKEKVMVKQCCASCQHREILEDGTRLCKQMQLYVKRKYVCSKWKKSKRFKNGPMGKVKRREYLLFVMAVRAMEQDAIDNELIRPEDVCSVRMLRQRFEEIFGLSPYIIY